MTEKITVLLSFDDIYIHELTSLFDEIPTSESIEIQRIDSDGIVPIQIDSGYFIPLLQYYCEVLIDTDNIRIEIMAIDSYFDNDWSFLISTG